MGDEERCGRGEGKEVRSGRRGWLWVWVSGVQGVGGQGVLGGEGTLVYEPEELVTEGVERVGRGEGSDETIRRALAPAREE